MLSAYDPDSCTTIVFLSPRTLHTTQYFAAGADSEFCDGSQYDSNLHKYIRRDPAMKPMYPRRAQFISLDPYADLASALMDFDIDMAAVAFDGDRVWGLPRAIEAIATRTFRVRPQIMEHARNLNRIRKYRDRGFEPKFLCLFCRGGEHAGMCKGEPPVCGPGNDCVHQTVSLEPTVYTDRVPPSDAVRWTGSETGLRDYVQWSNRTGMDARQVHQAIDDAAHIAGDAANYVEKTMACCHRRSAMSSARSDAGAPREGGGHLRFDGDKDFYDKAWESSCFCCSDAPGSFCCSDNEALQNCKPFESLCCENMYYSHLCFERTKGDAVKFFANLYQWPDAMKDAAAELPPCVLGACRMCRATYFIHAFPELQFGDAKVRRNVRPLFTYICTTGTIDSRYTYTARPHFALDD